MQVNLAASHTIERFNVAPSICKNKNGKKKKEIVKPRRRDDNA